jgi:hypothetical protein
VVHLFERAREGHVSVLNIEATQETKVPIVVPLVFIGELRILHLLLYSLHGRKLPVAPNKKDNVAGHRYCGPCGVHVISKRGLTLSSMSTSMFAPFTMSPTPSVEGAHQKNLLHWDGELLDG